MPPPISQQQWPTRMTSSSSSQTDSRPFTTPCSSTSPHRLQEGLLVLKRLSQHPNITTGRHRSFTNGGQRPRFGLPPPMPPPPIKRRQQWFSHVWKGLVRAVMHKFASMSAWRPTLGLRGQISKRRSRNQEWARSQLLHLRQGPRQRIDNFLAQFQALMVQSACLNEYAKDLLERAVQQKVLEQVYIRGLPRETWEQVVGAVHTVGRAQELFLINMETPTRYFDTNNYTTSSTTPLGSSAPMDIGAANTCPQRGKGIQCYNCQGFGHISHECSQPRQARKQGPQ